MPTDATSLIVRAPAAGWAASLDETPDEVFAGRMLGDGLAFEPLEGVIRAPFDGVVAALPRSRHAVTLRADNGVEVLVHVGVDTVRLDGAGFTAEVKDGDRVVVGQPLIRFDLDAVAAAAPSLMSPVVVLTEGARIEGRALGRVAAGDVLFTVIAAGAAARAERVGPASERSVAAVLPHGLHARPAGRLAAALRGLRAEVQMSTGGRSAAVSSPVALMALGVRNGDPLHLSATGPDAVTALDRLEGLLAGGLDELHAPPVAPVVVRAAAAPIEGPDGELTLGGVMAAPGLALGPAARLRATAVAVAAQGRGEEIEGRALSDALSRVAERLRESIAGGGEQAAILGAHLAFLEDAELLAGARRAIADGRSAGLAWREATATAVTALRGLGDARMAARADDLLDVERQVLLALAGEGPARFDDIAAGSVVLAETLLPSQLVALHARGVAAVCTADGGPTSHVAILCASMGLPALVAIGRDLDRVEDGDAVVVEADAGRLIGRPAQATRARIEAAVTGGAVRRAEARAAAGADAATADGVRIEVFANLGAASETRDAVAGGAEGCGLLRTEFLFLDRETAPSEDEQAAQYQAIAEALGGRPLVIRTLDAGGDKPIAYLPMAPEENPALGLRGIRSMLDRPDLLETQLRAVCRVTSAGTVAIMLPMVSSLSEVEAARTVLDHVAGEGPRPLLGVMVETPAAAVTVDLLAPAIDFVSIGTNDLTQYALAMDRQNPRLAARLDALHPAVLRLIARTAEGGKALKWIGVCGGLASDPVAAPILVGLGVTELSAAPAQVAEVKAAIRRFTLNQCRALAARALTQTDAAAVRSLAAEALAQT